MKPRIIAFYLPQYYPTDFNDEWWEPGFTEWTNVTKATPLFPGHYQPKLPGALGFYDLRLAETREKQAELATKAGVESFMYWHYWTAGKKVLNEVFEDVVKLGKPDIGFSLCWANHSWTKCAWNGFKDTTMLLEQKYPGKQDYIDHFNYLLPAFNDARYTRVDGKLLFAVFAPFSIPDIKEFVEIWQNLAIKNNLNGFYFVAYNRERTKVGELRKMGFECVLEDLMDDFRNSHWAYNNIFCRALRKLFGIPVGNNAKDYYDFFVKHFEFENGISPCIYPNWDHSARSGNIATIFRNAEPIYWGDFCRRLLAKMQKNDELVFVKSWNEWGEGNYMEPDRRYGMGYIDELRKAMDAADE